MSKFLDSTAGCTYLEVATFADERQRAQWNDGDNEEHGPSGQISRSRNNSKDARFGSEEPDGQRIALVVELPVIGHDESCLKFI